VSQFGGRLDDNAQQRLKAECGIENLAHLDDAFQIGNAPLSSPRVSIRHIPCLGLIYPTEKRLADYTTETTGLSMQRKTALNRGNKNRSPVLGNIAKAPAENSA
jgi:hypothetical protein